MSHVIYHDTPPHPFRSLSSLFFACARTHTHHARAEPAGAGRRGLGVRVQGAHPPPQARRAHTRTRTHAPPPPGRSPLEPPPQPGPLPERVGAAQTSGARRAASAPLAADGFTRGCETTARSLPHSCGKAPAGAVVCVSGTCVDRLRWWGYCLTSVCGGGITDVVVMPLASPVTASLAWAARARRGRRGQGVRRDDASG